MKKRIGKITATSIVLLAAAAIFSMGSLSDPHEVTNWSNIPFATTNTNPVTGWYNVVAGQMYDKTNNVLDSDPTWTDCVTAITIDQYSGLYKDTPESTMPNGWYVWRQWDSAAPAYTDEVKKSVYVFWDANTGRITKIGDI